MIIFYLAVVSVINALIILCPELSRGLFFVSSISFSMIVLLDALHNMRSKNTWFDPYSLFILKNFFLGYGIIAYIPVKRNFGEIGKQFQMLNNAMVYANLAYISFYVAYRLDILKKIVNRITSISSRIIRPEFKINWFWLLSVYAISIGIRLVLISQGVFGYLSTIKKQTSSLPGFVAGLSDLGNLILFIVLFTYYKNKNHTPLMIVIFIVESMFAVISGFKGSIVILFVFAVFAQYLVKKKVSIYMIVLASISILFSYVYVEPYRQFLQKNTSISSISEFSNVVHYIANNFSSQTKMHDESIISSLVSRFSYLNEFIGMISYKTTNQYIFSTPNFKLRFWQAPLITFIPRSIWHDKPTNELGMTFVTWIVQGNSGVMSSSAFGPLGSLYFAGPLYVILGFAFYAFIVRFAAKCASMNMAGYLIIGLAAFYSSFFLEQEFSFIFATIVQTIVVAYIGQLFLFRK